MISPYTSIFPKLILAVIDFRVTSCEMFVTALEWDFCGLLLLVADASGQVGIWEFKDFSLNEWVCVGTVSFHGEYIIGGTFFHNGKKVR